MGPGYLLDSNICLYFLNQTLTPDGYAFVGSAIDRSDGFLSVVSQLELLGFAFPSAEEQRITEQFVADMPILPLTDAIVRQTIEVRRQRKIKVPDAIIAATALVHGLTLVTNDVSDFKGIAGLTLVNPLPPA